MHACVAISCLYFCFHQVSFSSVETICEVNVSAPEIQQTRQIKLNENN